VKLRDQPAPVCGGRAQCLLQCGFRLRFTGEQKVRHATSLGFFEFVVMSLEIGANFGFGDVRRTGHALPHVAQEFVA